MGIISSAVIGGIAGLIAEKVMKEDHGILTNIFVGVLGGIAGGWVFSLLGIGTEDGYFGSLITAVVGACVILYLYGIVRKKEGHPQEFTSHDSDDVSEK